MGHNIHHIVGVSTRQCYRLKQTDFRNWFSNVTARVKFDHRDDSVQRKLFWNLQAVIPIVLLILTVLLVVTYVPSLA